MTSDDKETAGGASSGEDAGSPKRPARTIELEAEEVEIEVKPDPNDGDESDERGDRTGKAEGKDKSRVRPKPPPQRTRPSDVRSFVTHLAAGLIGGLVGVVGAGVGLEKLPLAGLLGEGAETEKISAIEQRLNTLDEKLKGQAKSLDGVAKSLVGAARSDALGKLEARLAGIENKPAPAPALPPEVGERLAKLEGSLKTLASAGGEDGASGVEVSAALTARIDMVASDVEKRAGALSEEFSELKKAFQALEVPPAQQDSGDGEAVKALVPRLVALEDKVSMLAERPAVPTTPSAPAPVVPTVKGDGAVLALAFESLWRAVEGGDAFTAQLEAVGELAPEGVDLSILKSMAGSGVETERSLLRTLGPLLREARAAAARSDDDGFIDRLVSNAQSAVRVRRIGPAEGESAAAVLARMEAHMKHAELSRVLSEAKSLKGPAQESLQDWLKRAEAHQASRSALFAIEKSLLARLKSGAKAQR